LDAGEREGAACIEADVAPSLRKPHCAPPDRLTSLRLGYPARRFTGAAMRVGKSSRSVADARVLATATAWPICSTNHRPRCTRPADFWCSPAMRCSRCRRRHPPGSSPALPRRPSRFRGPFAPDRWYSGVTSCASECAPIRAIGRSPYLRTAVHATPECRPALRDGEPRLPRATDGGFHDLSRIDGACSFGQYIRSIGIKSPCGAGSQLASLSLPGESCWK